MCITNRLHVRGLDILMFPPSASGHFRGESSCHSSEGDIQAPFLVGRGSSGCDDLILYFFTLIVLQQRSVAVRPVLYPPQGGEKDLEVNRPS